jgi:hypothetical protein
LILGSKLQPTCTGLGTHCMAGFGISLVSIRVLLPRS